MILLRGVKKMAYEIVMPQLSDSMEEGKLISWKVKEGDSVNVGDTLAEVESDKAILEVQSFKKGVVKALKVKEGEEASVGTVIAEIETEESSMPKEETGKKEEIKPAAPPVKEETEQNKPKEAAAAETPEKEVSTKETAAPATFMASQSHASASPKAKALAAKYGIDIEALQKENTLPAQVHEADVMAHLQRHYFTAKALELIDRYHLAFDLFETGKKHSEAEIEAYIETHNIPLPKPLTPNRKAVIATVTESAKKPVYHLYDTIDARLIASHADHTHTFTVWLLKLFAEAMMQHDALRTTLGKNGLQVWPSAAISVAMVNEEALYMPVLKALEEKSPDEIADMLAHLKEKVKGQKLLPEEMKGSTFGLSNLGMTGIERFDAMVNGEDCGIAAIGAEIDGKLSVTLTLDHRIVNGYQAARFMQTLKTLAKDAMFFKGK